MLIVEDDEAIRVAVEQGLSLHGFDVTGASSAEAALDRLRLRPADVMIVDIGLPGLSGIELCQTLRAHGSTIPILILSARDSVSDRIEGLQAGADDYLVKPFDLAELVARLAALLRRSRAPRTEPRDGLSVHTAGQIVVEPERRVVTVAGNRLDLTRREFDLLETFVINRHTVLSRVQLLELVWGYDFDLDTNVVDVFVGYLRKKLAAGGADNVIRTVRGVGFVLEPDAT